VRVKGRALGDHNELKGMEISVKIRLFASNAFRPRNLLVRFHPRKGKGTHSKAGSTTTTAAAVTKGKAEGGGSRPEVQKQL
jgi:hypothetical protein